MATLNLFSLPLPEAPIMGQTWVSLSHLQFSFTEFVVKTFGNKRVDLCYSKCGPAYKSIIPCKCKILRPYLDLLE